jgi:hypothetical protein
LSCVSVETNASAVFDSAETETRGQLSFEGMCLSTAMRLGRLLTGSGFHRAEQTAKGLRMGEDRRTPVPLSVSDRDFLTFETVPGDLDRGIVPLVVMAQREGARWAGVGEQLSVRRVRGPR